MKIAILGGGNIGMSLVGEISRLKDIEVVLYTSKADCFLERIDVLDSEKNICFQSGKFDSTDDMKYAVEDADVIFCTFPAFVRQQVINEMENFIKDSAVLGFVPGYGGAELYCEKLIKKGVTIFGLQKVPYVSRTVKVGEVAGIMSRKKKLFVAAIPSAKTERIARMMENLLVIETCALKNYMAATLLPGNPLLHTSGSYIMLKNYKTGDYFKDEIYYYQAWDDQCSRVICSFSDEMMAVCNALPLDLSEVLSIQEYYESETPELLTKKFKNIPSFYPLTLPMIENEKGFIPDFNSRFFTEDIPFGVCVIKGLALIVDVKTPTIDKILAWYKDMTGKEYFRSDDTYGKDIKETAIPQLFGLNKKEDLKLFYDR